MFDVNNVTFRAFHALSAAGGDHGHRCTGTNCSGVHMSRSAGQAYSHAEVMVVCALASTLAIRVALKVDPAAAIGG